MLWLLVCLLTLSACTAPLTLDTSPPETTVFLPSPETTVQVVLLASAQTEAYAVPAPIKGVSKPPRPLDPSTLVANAHKAARVYPTPRGYFGGTADYHYPWVSGKLFVILVHPGSATRISLPQGERLVAGLSLNPDAWDVATVRIGQEVMASDVVYVRPLMDTGSAETGLVTESGRKYDVVLQIGSVGMVAVTFELPPIMQVQEPELVLPRPPR